jgi:hypothetical protein
VKIKKMVPQAGVEPACPKALASKASVSSNSTTGAEKCSGAQGEIRTPKVPGFEAGASSSSAT